MMRWTIEGSTLNCLAILRAPLLKYFRARMTCAPCKLSVTRTTRRQLLRWHHPCLRCYLGHVRDKSRLSPADGPGDRSREHFLKTLTGPDIITMAHCVIVHAALALFTGPGEREWRPLVFGALHSVSLQDEQNVHVLREVLERVPLLLDREGFTGTKEAREFRIDHLHTRLLLVSVADELAAKHRDKRVRIFLRLETVALRVERVARGVHADESLSVAYRGEKRLFPRRAHGGHLVGAGLDQISRREEEESIVLSQIAVEHAPILRGDDLESVLPADG